MMNHPDRVNRLEAVQSLIALHVGMVSIVLGISHSNHLDDDVKSDAENPTKNQTKYYPSYLFY